MLNLDGLPHVSLYFLEGSEAFSFLPLRGEGQLETCKRVRLLKLKLKEGELEVQCQTCAFPVNFYVFLVDGHGDIDVF